MGVFVTILFLLVVAAFIGYDYYKRVLYANVPEKLDTEYIHIPTNSSYEEVVSLLREEGFIKNESSFRWVAEQMEYKRDPMRSGRFKIKPGWNNYELVSHLRGGKQATTKVVLNNERLIEDVAGKVSRFIESDSFDILYLLKNEEFLEEVGYTKDNLMTLFIPNTYDFYWNTSPQQFVKRMIQEHQQFWEKDNRLQKAKNREMTSEEVYTLASIVEKETLQNSEKKRMAGVYLNRVEKNMLLQADPTCVFATRDFNTKRVTNYHLEFDSPYNTYLYTGLPPGPISMASISSIDAVLNAEDHNYLYFCAKGDGTGYHAFAKNLAAHNQNAARYRNNLRKRGLR